MNKAVKKKVLFVCTGNTCRSVIAEFMFRRMLAEAGKTPGGAAIPADIEASSAGIAAIPGMNTAPGTVKVLREEGIDASGHKSKNLDGRLAREAGIIVAMEKKHVEEILDMRGTDGCRVELIGSFAGEGRRYVDLPDPFGHSIQVYRECRERIREGLKGLLAEIIAGKI